MHLHWYKLLCTKLINYVSKVLLMLMQPKVFIKKYCQVWLGGIQNVTNN